MHGACVQNVCVCMCVGGVGVCLVLRILGSDVHVHLYVCEGVMCAWCMCAERMCVHVCW